MTEFTKGPWVAISRGFFGGREEGDVHQKDNWDVDMQGGEFMRGNFRMEDAHLIAAAPDLYEALSEMVEQAIGCWHNHYGHEQDPNDMPMPEHIGKAHLALAKARGEA